MNSIASLNGSHRRTYETIFQHPVSHNLEWRGVLSLLKQLGSAEDEANGNVKVTRNAQTLVLHRPHTKDVANAEEVLSLRHFLKKSEPVQPAGEAANTHCLVVINHDGARIFHSEVHGTAPQRIEPGGYFRHSFQVDNFSHGKDRPDPNSFFKPISAALPATGQILIFGPGTGTSSEMAQFVSWLQTHHPEQAGRIVGSLVVDEHHLTQDQILAKARDFFLEAGRPILKSANATRPEPANQNPAQPKHKE